MKLLTETEQGHFQGTLTGLSLPPKAALYISHGLPTVFQLAEPSARSQSLGLWLHIPYEQLASVRHRLAVETSDPQPNHVADCCLEADDLNLYPVLVAGEIRAVIATDRETTFAPDRGGGGDIVESLSGRYGRSGLDDSLVTREFLRCLFDRDRSFDEFQRAMLNLVTSQWPRSLGALYFESEGVFKLRLAVGDIHLSDRLEGTLSPQRARSWTGAVREQRYFTSADMMPDYPVVLDHAPNYVFVHPGIQSERTEYLVALLMSGDIGAEQVRAVMQIARMTGYLHEAQFSTTAETVSLYGCLQELPTSNNRFRELLGKVFEVVGRQIDLSRLVVGDVGGSATVLVNQGEERPIFRSEPSPPIPTEVLHSLSPEEPVMVPEVATDPRHEGVTNGYSADRVASEIIFGTGLAGSIQGYVAFGSSLTGEHLDRYRDFFIAISRFVRLTRQLMASRPNDTLIGAPKKTIESDTMARDRLDTIAKLAGGYFHDIMEYLSVVVGQNELIESEAADTMAVEKGAIRVRKAADRIADYLDKLRSLCMLTTDQLGRRLSVRCFLEDLPTIVQGYARQIRDNKNVVLTIDTEHPGDTDFEITWQELYDWVLPLVLGIMDEAICSGPLTVRTESVEGRPGMAFEFPASIIGHTNSGELIGRIYAHWSGERSGEQQGSVRFRGMALSFGPGAKDSCLVRIQPTEK
ncbi:MAG: hypothetical protein OEV80_17000, partial [candidate division Zixibacteria bacterium]|nr:hypothetical protein [candidate division Zixibacteria bacterium]